MRGWKRKTLLGGALLLLLAGLLALLAPTIASTGFVRRQLETWLSAELRAEVAIEELDLGWSGPLALRGLTVRGAEGEFAGDELARLDEARVEPGLWRLWRGADSIATQVRGLRVTVDERGAGRTNLDPFLRRFFAPRAPAVEPAPEPAVAAPPRRLPPIDATLTDCTVRLRRLPYTPPAERINPFEQDVPVRAADAGFDLYQLTTANVHVRIDGKDIDAQADGAISHGADTTAFSADVKVRDGVPQGTLAVDDLDLELMDPFVAGKLGGRVSARAEGRIESGLVRASVAVEVKDLVTDRLREDWIRATLQVRQHPSHYAIGPVDFTSASGRFAAKGDLTIPADEPYRPSGDLSGTFPLAIAYRAFTHRQPPIEAQVHFDLKSQLEHEGGHAAGTVHFDHFSAPERPGEITVAFDLAGDRARKNLRIDKLEVRSRYADVTVRGKVHHGRDWTLDLNGEVDGDLERVHHLLDHFVALPDDLDVTGRCSVQVHGVTRTADGVVRVVADARLVGLKARGVDPAPLDYPDLTVHVDASIVDDGDRVIVNDARIKDVRIAGSARGLRDPAEHPVIAGTAAGSFPFSERLLTVLGIEEVRDPSGGAEVDLRLNAADGNASLDGTVRVRGLKFRVGTYDNADPDFEWKGSLRWREGKLAGGFSLHGPRLQADVTDLDFDPSAKAARLKAKLVVPDAAVLRNLLLDPRFTWSGRHEANAELVMAGDSLQIAGSIRAPALRFEFDGYGLPGDDTRADTTVEYRDGAWHVRDTTLRVLSRDLVARSKQLRILDDGMDGDIDVTGRFEGLATLVEPLRRFDLRGAFHAASRLRIADEVEGDLRIDAPAFAFGDEALGDVTLRIPRARVGDRIEIPAYSLSVGKELAATGALSLDDQLSLHVDAKGGNVGWVTHFVDGLSGRGAFEIAADLRAPRLALDGEYRLSGTARTDRLDLPDGLVLHAPRLEAKEFRFRAERGSLHEFVVDTEMHAERLERHGLTVANVTVRNTGNGPILSDGSGDGHRIHVVTGADYVTIDGRKLEGLKLDGWGALKSLDVEDARSLRFDGRLDFERVPAAILDWTGGHADFTYRQHVLDVSKLVATVQGGSMTGSARFDFRPTHVPWSVKIRTVDAKLDSKFADPLSYIIPVLRVAGDPNAMVSGFASWDVELRGTGFTFDDLEKHLVGSGNLRLRDARVKGSLLLPLLSLRVGRLLLNKPFVIPDSTAEWSVKDGLVTTEPLKISARPFGISMGGTVTLRGQLDYIFHPGILLVPISVKGKWDDITVLPTARGLLPKWPFK